MKITAVMLAAGHIPQIQESLASFLSQDYPDKEIIIVSVLPRQTLVFDNAQVRLYNPNAAAVAHAREELGDGSGER